MNRSRCIDYAKTSTAIVWYKYFHRADFCIVRIDRLPANGDLVPERWGLRRGHYPVPLCSCDVGRVLQVQTRALGLAVGGDFDRDRRLHSRDAAKQQTAILKSNYEQATANVVGLTSQVAFNAKRLADIQKLVADDANTQFQGQDRQNQYETSLAQLNVAKAAQQSAKLALDSEIGGVNTTVAQMQAQLENAVWELAQTTIRAPADGYATSVALTVGDRAFQLRSAMSFIVENEITIVGMFSQNGFQTIKPGAPVNIVFDNAPGRIYHARITEIPKGIGQGQIATSGTLARTNAIGGASAFPALISIPDEISRDSLQLGMSGSATAFAPNAGVIGLLASILVWVSSYTAYL
jgi:multidrug resistance efflux pump